MSLPERALDFRLPREERLRDSNDFTAIFDRGQWGTHNLLRIVLQRNTLVQRRLGLSVSRRFGNAVQRNRLKRRFREAFRQVKHELPAGIDCVMLPSRKCSDPQLTALIQVLPELIRKTLIRLDRRRRRAKRRE